MDLELSNIRDTVMVIAKTIQLQGAQNLPGHDDVVWRMYGPLGGVQYVLDLLQKHVRVSVSP